MNMRVIPYVNQKRLGTYYIKERTISQNDMFVNCKANDRLLDFQNIKYKGLMPQSDNERKTFKELFESVLDFANESYVRKFKYAIDGILYNPIVVNGIDINSVEPYLPRESVWNVLQILCNASMSHIYVDENDVICINSEIAGEHTGYDNDNSEAEINTTNAFTIDIPNFADMGANNVEIAYFEKQNKDDQELCKIDVIPGTTEYEVQFDDFCIIDKVEIYVGNSFNSSLSVLKKLDFIYSTSITTSQSNMQDATIKFFGTKITFDKKNLTKGNTESLNKTSLNVYTHAESKLIQNKVLAESIADRIMEIYAPETKSSFASWRGDENYTLAQKFNISDRFGGKAEYRLTYLKSIVDGGFRQEVKGVQKEIVTVGHLPDKLPQLNLPKQPTFLG